VREEDDGLRNDDREEVASDSGAWGPGVGRSGGHPSIASQ